MFASGKATVFLRSSKKATSLLEGKRELHLASLRQLVAGAFSCHKTAWRQITEPHQRPYRWPRAARIARWATRRAVRSYYTMVPYEPQKWRTQPELRPTDSGFVLGSFQHGRHGKKITAWIDSGDSHAMMSEEIEWTEYAASHCADKT